MGTILGDSSCASCGSLVHRASICDKILSSPAADNVEAKRTARGQCVEPTPWNVDTAPTSITTYEISNLDLARLRMRCIYRRNAGEYLLVISVLGNVFLNRKAQRSWLIHPDGQDAPNSHEAKRSNTRRAVVFELFETVVLVGPCSWFRCRRCTCRSHCQQVTGAEIPAIVEGGFGHGRDIDRTVAGSAPNTYAQLAVPVDGDGNGNIQAKAAPRDVVKSSAST